jgi:hypothetical protein
MWPENQRNKSELAVKLTDKPQSFERWVRAKLWITPHEPVAWESDEIRRQFLFWQNEADISASLASPALMPRLLDRPQAFERWYREKHWVSAHVAMEWSGEHVEREFFAWSAEFFSENSKNEWT